MAGLELGFVGIGKMGSLMAKRLVDAGHSLTIYDTTEAAMAPLLVAGAKKAASARAVADNAPIVFVSLPMPDIVGKVALEEVAQGTAVKTFVDLSTTGPRVAKAVAKGLSEKGIVSVDCPVSGGLAGARDGKLALMVSGPRATYDALEEVLKIFGKPFFIGETAGAGQTMKLVNNLLAACAIAITSEGLVMGVKAGLDPKVMCDVINVSSGRNTATMDKFPRSVIPGTFDFGFATGLSYKDVRLCLDEGEAMGVPMPVGAVVRQMLAVTNALYGPDSDFTSMVRPVEQWAGVEVRSK